MVKCGDCGAVTRSTCTCQWSVKILYNTTFIFARYKATATYGSFRFQLELSSYAWTIDGAEKRIRRRIRKYAKRQKTRDAVREFTVEKGIKPKEDK